MKRLLFLSLLPFSVIGMQRELLPLTYLCLQKNIALSQNDPAFRYQMVERVPTDLKELLRSVFCQTSHLMKMIVIKEIIRPATIDYNIILSAAWHPTDSKIAIGGDRGNIWILDIDTKSIEEVGNEHSGICDLGWTCDGKSLESRKEESIHAWQKNSETKQWFQTFIENDKCFITPSNIRKRNNSNILAAYISDDHKRVNICDSNNEKNIFLNIQACKEAVMEEGASHKVEYIQKIQNIEWGLNHLLAVFLANETITYYDAKNCVWLYSPFQEHSDGEINIYFVNNEGCYLYAKMPTTIKKSARLLWSVNGDYLACYEGQNIEIIPIKIAENSLEELFALYDQCKNL